MSALQLPRVLRFPVEEGHVRIFARALGDDNPIFRDPDHAARSAFGAMIAPPTFTEAANHFDEDWPYRPRHDRPWFGSGATPSGGPRPGGEGGTAMHAETHFTYFKPLLVGTVLSGQSRQGRQWEKHGLRSGRLSFAEVVTTFVDQMGEPVVECATVALTTERTVDDAGVPPAQATAPAPRSLPPVTRLSRGDWRKGASVKTVLVTNLTRGQITQYAGASGDFSPQHTDEVYNTQAAGYPGVFAHGMLTMGMLGQALNNWLGDGLLKSFGFQFRQQVWPGDTLYAALEITELSEEALATLGLTVTNQNGQMVGKGYATALASI
jgi:peroxisomal enoyl-CoA hydratase 2